MGDELPVVVSPEEMTDDTFLQHFLFRHGDWMGGLSEFTHHISSDTIRCYRTYHDQLHALLYGLFGIEEDHIHEQ